MFKITPTPLEKQDLRKGLSSSSAGAFCTFEGWVRDHHQGKKVLYLEYETSEKLCQREAEKILHEAEEKFDIFKVRCFHRMGKVQIGEMAVWVGVMSAHRDAAFGACRHVIDEIKRRLPIWKKEFYQDGTSVWVSCQEDEEHLLQSTLKIESIKP